LTEYENGVLKMVTSEDEEISVPRKEISHMNLVYFEED
jgi:hypothetical protein